jgi:hypothetical protein
MHGLWDANKSLCTQCVFKSTIKTTIMKNNYFLKVNLTKQKATHIVLTFLLLMISIMGFAQASGETINLGLYGGKSNDLTYCYTNNRLFAGVETPASIFYSDDTCNTWTQAFQIDSLEYDLGNRGWGGGAPKILANGNGWIAARTSQQGGTLTSSQISYLEGDSGTFITAVDGEILSQIKPGAPSRPVTGIGLSDHYMYVAVSEYILRINDTTTNGEYRVVAIADTIPGMTSNPRVGDLAVANHESGLPFYTTIFPEGANYSILYKFENGFTELAVPLNMAVEEVFTHPAQITGDTVIISTRDTITQNRAVYISEDGGGSWNDITPSFGIFDALQNADYSPNWVSKMPLSNGLRLSFPGGKVSDDLGASWSIHLLPDNALATHPADTAIVIGSLGVGVAVSMSGAYGPFIRASNEGMSAVSITKIANDASVFYVSTNAGLGYTTAYFDPLVVGIEKWQAPYGDFPMSGIGSDQGVSCVAIDPNNDQHVIAGYTDGFELSFTGPSGFSKVTPTGWNASTTNYDFRINDVKFVNSDTIIAVSGTGLNEIPDWSWGYGNIWRSTDGGLSWSTVTPAGFFQGNCLVVGTANNDTVIYAGMGYAGEPVTNVDGELWVSTDYGDTWTAVNDGPTGQHQGTLKMPIYDIDIDHRGNDTIYLASGNNLDHAFVRSTDGGTTYNYLNVFTQGAFSTVLVDNSNPAIVSVGARRKLYRYNTVLNTFINTFTGLPAEFVPDLENGSTILGTTTGVYKLVEEYGAITSTWNGNGNWTNNGNWSNGIPTYLDNAIIESGILDVDILSEVFHLTIKSGVNITINVGEKLNVGGDLILESDSDGYASLIDNGSLIVNGETKIQKYITDDAWHFIAPPVSSATATVFNGLHLKNFDESTNAWNFIEDPTYPLELGKAYSTHTDTLSTGDQCIEFTGTLQSSAQTPQLNYSGPDYGFNLIGNPYPSAIDWGSVNEPISGYSFSHVDKTIYFWNGTQYACYNPALNAGDGYSTNGADKIIPALQGFYVHANSNNPQLTIPAQARLHNAKAFMKSRDNLQELLKFNVSGNAYSDETIINFISDATNQFDSEYDAYKLFGIEEAPQIYTVFNGDELSINVLDEVSEDLLIPLALQVGSAGTYSLSAIGIYSFDAGIDLILEDLLEDSTISLREDSVYTFQSNPGDDPLRFNVKFFAGGTTIWNGNGNWSNTANWSEGVPSDLDIAIVESGDLNIDIDAQAHILTLRPEVMLTLNSGVSLHVYTEFTLESNEDASASFINNGSLQIDGESKVQRFISSNQWHFITTPVENSTTEVFDDLLLQQFEEATNTWAFIQNPSYELIPGKGYSTITDTVPSSNETLEFSGDLISSNYSPEITFNGGELGLNLVGNAFTSAIDWGSGNNPVSGYVQTNIDNTIYFWNGTQYACYNPVLNSGDGYSTNGADQIIPAMQAFFVHANANNPQLTIPAQARLHNAKAFLKSRAGLQDLLTFEVTGNGFSDETVINFIGAASNQFDSEYDAYKLFGIEEAPQIYSAFNNEDLSINVLPEIFDSLLIPLALEVGVNEIYTLNASGIFSFDADVDLFLEDFVQDSIIDLREDSMYVFSSDPNDDPIRFQLRFEPLSTSINNIGTDNSILIYSAFSKLIIKNKSESDPIKKVEIYTLAGKKIYDGLHSNEKTVTIGLSRHSALLIVKVITENSVLSRKILIGKSY